MTEYETAPGGHTTTDDLVISIQDNLATIEDDMVTFVKTKRLEIEKKILEGPKFFPYAKSYNKASFIFYNHIIGTAL